MSNKDNLVLLIDEGNSFVKWAIIKQSKLLTSGVEKSMTAKLLRLIKKQYPSLNQIFLSTVRTKGLSTMTYLNGWTINHLNPKSKVPFKNKYKTPKTLGADRKALVSAACSFYPSSDVLIIGTGTCITYDFKDSNNVYHGGAISPGLQMRLDAMAHFTAKLPQLDAYSILSTEGNDTQSAMFRGALEGLTHEINGFIETYKKAYGSGLKVMLAGGDALRLESRLKRRIFVEPHLALYGLLSLYELNQKK